MLLIADLINLNGILSLTDIQKILHELKISTPQSVLKKYISLLEQLDLISVEPYGKLTFYVTRRDAPPYIQYAPKVPNKSVERLTLWPLILKDFAHTGEKKKAYDAYKRRAEKETS